MYDEGPDDEDDVAYDVEDGEDDGDVSIIDIIDEEDQDNDQDHAEDGVSPRDKPCREYGGNLSKTMVQYMRSEDSCETAKLFDCPARGACETLRKVRWENIRALRATIEGDSSPNPLIP